MYNGRAALSCSMNLFPTENYFTAATKRVISSIQSFTKKISKRKGKDSGEIVLYPVNIFSDVCKFFSDEARQSDVIYIFCLTDVDRLPWKSQSEFCVVRATH